MRKKNVKIVDTNLLVRYFIEDTKDQAESVEQLFKNAKQNEIEIPDLVVAELVWVLLSFYKLAKVEIVERVESLLSLQHVKMNRIILGKTTAFYRRYNVSFIDAYLSAYSLVKARGEIYSFDEGLGKIKEVKRLDPKDQKRVYV